MNSHFELTDKEFMDSFENGTLDPSIFSHEAHLRLAWVHIRENGVEQAIKNIQEQLEKYVSAIGATSKYNRTLTVAAIRAVYHFMLKSETTTFKDFILENPRLKTHFKELISCHYSQEVINSKKAKHKYLEPDLFPFD